MDETTTVKVTVSKVIFQKGDFYIFACKGGLSVKGKFAGNIIVGADYEVTGVEGEYKGKPQIIASLIQQVDVSKVRQTLIASFLEMVGQFRTTSETADVISTLRSITEPLAPIQTDAIKICVRFKS